MEVRFTQSARKHRIGKARARYVMEAYKPAVTPATSTSSERRLWVGTDHRGVELEIVALTEPNYLLVIHVMPTALRRK